MHSSGTLLLCVFLAAGSFKLVVCRLKGLVASLQSREILAPSRLADGRLMFLLNALNNRTANERGQGAGPDVPSCLAHKGTHRFLVSLPLCRGLLFKVHV